MNPVGAAEQREAAMQCIGRAEIAAFGSSYKMCIAWRQTLARFSIPRQRLRHLHQIGKGLGLHFFHGVAAMDFDGDFA